MLTAEQINGAVAEAMPNVLAGLKREISERAINQARDAALEAIRKAVTEWVTAEIVPELQKALIEGKQGLIATVPAMTQAITEQLSAALKDSLTKRLENSWERQKVFKALFD